MERVNRYTLNGFKHRTHWFKIKNICLLGIILLLLSTTIHVRMCLAREKGFSNPIPKFFGLIKKKNTI